MIINIKTLSTKIINLQVNGKDTINQIKEKLQEMEGIQPDYQRLLFRGKILGNDSNLEENGITSGSMLYIVFALMEGSEHDDKKYVDMNLIEDFTKSPFVWNDKDSEYIESDQSYYEISFSDVNSIRLSGSSDSSNPQYKKKKCCGIF